MNMKGANQVHTASGKFYYAKWQTLLLGWKGQHLHWDIPGAQMCALA